MASETTGHELLTQLIEVRSIIELEASRFAAIRATAEQVAELTEALGDMWKDFEADDTSGSGIMLMSDQELSDLAHLGADHGMPSDAS